MSEDSVTFEQWYDQDRDEMVARCDGGTVRASIAELHAEARRARDAWHLRVDGLMAR